MVVVVVAPVGKRLVPAGARAGPVGGDASSVVPPSEVTRSTDKGGAESCSFLRKNRGMLMVGIGGSRRRRRPKFSI